MLFKDTSLIAWHCDTIASCFQKTALDNYDSDSFVNEFISNDYCRSILLDDLAKPYYNWTYMYSKIIKNIKTTKGIARSEYVMWSYGYLLKYWINTKDAYPEDIVKLMPLSKYDDYFTLYHTLSWNKIISKAINNN